MIITTCHDDYIRHLELFARSEPAGFPKSVSQDVFKATEQYQFTGVLASPSRWPELMSISTLAQYLDMSPSSVRNLVSEGVLPNATTAPTPRLKRWSKSVIDNTIQRFVDRKASHGLSMTDALKATQSFSMGGGRDD